jgi:hypothetical protein
VSAATKVRFSFASSAYRCPALFADMTRASRILLADPN